jgi:quercetin dioxygenase-like cupin family protein
MEVFLVPAGRPITIDHDSLVHGALRFTLDLHQVNLPITHAHETKAIFCLNGQIKIKISQKDFIFLSEGDYQIIQAGIAHRIYQCGEHSATIGIMLTPAGSMQAFFATDALIRAGTYSRLLRDRIFNEHGIRMQISILDYPQHHQLENQVNCAIEQRFPAAFLKHVMQLWQLKRL